MPLLTKIGEALYGPRWQAELARALGVSDRTIRRWVAGSEIPRPGVYADILAIARERGEAIKALLPDLEAATHSA